MNVSAPLLRTCLVIGLFALILPLASAQHNKNDARKARENALRNSIRQADRTIKSAQAHEKYLQEGIKRTEANLQQAMEQRVAEADGVVAAARPDIESAKEQLRRANSELREVETRVLESLPSDSPLRRAEAEYNRLQADYTAALKMVEADPTYQQEYQAAFASADKLKAVEDVRRRWIEGNARLRSLSSGTAIARKAFETERDKALHSDAAWQQISREVLGARSLASEAESQARILLTNKADASSKLRRAQGIATSLQNTLVAAKQELQQTKSLRERTIKRRDKLQRDLKNHTRNRR